MQPRNCLNLPQQTPQEPAKNKMEIDFDSTPNILTEKNINQYNDLDLQDINERHESLISEILVEEEQLISEHRTHIDEIVEITKKEMMMLHMVDKPGSDVELYVSNLSEILNNKKLMITSLMRKLNNFQSKLKDEEVLS